PRAISLARRTVNTMRQNILIALATVLALLSGVLFGGVTMAIGMLVHEVSVLVVIVNAMRLLRSRGEPAPRGGVQTGASADRRQLHQRVDIADEESPVRPVDEGARVL